MEKYRNSAFEVLGLVGLGKINFSPSGIPGISIIGLHGLSVLGLNASSLFRYNRFVTEKRYFKLQYGHHDSRMLDLQLTKPKIIL